MLIDLVCRLLVIVACLSWVYLWLCWWWEFYENFMGRGEEDNRSRVQWWVFRLMWLLKTFQNLMVYHLFQSWSCIFCDLFSYGFRSVFYKFNGNLILSSTFICLHFGYYIPDFICGETYCHFCLWYSSYSFLIFVESF